MEKTLPAPADGKQNRGFILGSLAFGHGVAHVYDQSFPVLMPAITSSLGLSNLQVALLLGIRHAGFGGVSLGGGVFVDMLRNQWGLTLTGCTALAAISFMAVGASPNYALLVVAVILVSIPGALWHLPATAALSRRFPDRRGFAVSIHSLGSSIGNVLGPFMAGALLSLFFWRNVLFMYAAPPLPVAVFVWWSLKDIGREGGSSARRRLSTQFTDTKKLLRNPIVLWLVLAGALRGVGLNELLNWTPFYLEEELGMGKLSAGIHYGLLAGMGIASAPVLGALSDKFGRKRILAPSLVSAAALAMLVVSTGDSFLLAAALAGAGLFSFALQQIILATILDVSGRGTEATATGLVFGLTGAISAGSPFIASVIIEHLGGYSSIYYYAGILTAMAAVIVIALPLTPRTGSPG